MKIDFNDAKKWVENALQFNPDKGAETAVREYCEMNDINATAAEVQQTAFMIIVEMVQEGK